MEIIKERKRKPKLPQKRGLIPEPSLDIGKSLEDSERHQEEEKARQVQHEFENEKHLPTTGKNVFILIAILVGVFFLTFGGYTAYQKITGAGIVNIDDLHQQNLNGNLDEKKGYVYNGYSFVFADGLWWTEMDKFGTVLKVPLHFGPREIENIVPKGAIDPKFNEGDEMYIAIDPDVADKYYTLALSELSFNIVKGLDRTPVGSCTKENWACENRTIVNCENNAAEKDVIELALGNETSIKVQGTCIKVTGKQFDLVKAVDRLLYQWYGVIK